ncbi:hypothetical protein [Photobacterium leiognathi]|uniref:hypothetical protein n=1 Tax=Photobacterium leiognathi TaxID=553611 RepID=UPI0029828989|nr:hypothetical protein [Photobacterium leiognathi]
MKSEWFDPHKSFLSLKIAWGTVLILATMSISSAVMIVFNSELKPDLSYSGFNHFISVFRFPLAIAALIIPVVALLAANHRSEQTKEQIKVTNSQNIFSNYYKHMEEFTKYLLPRVDKEVDLRFAHSKFFPDSSLGDYAISSKLVSLLSELGNVAKEVLEQYPIDFNQSLDIELKKKYYVLIHEVYSFIYRDRDAYIKHITHTRRDDGYEGSYLFESISLIRHTLTAIKITEEACKFSSEYVSPVKELNLKFQDLNKVYIYKRTGDRASFVYEQNKDEQTFEEANENFMDILRKAVTVS